MLQHNIPASRTFGKRPQDCLAFVKLWESLGKSAGNGLGRFEKECERFLKGLANGNGNRNGKQMREKG